HFSAAPYVSSGAGRRKNPCPKFPLSSLLEGYKSFSSVGSLQDVLAAANEEGIVRIYNTENREQPLLKEWLAHENAVFDIAWVPGESQLVTAAGDQTARLWDGHLCSLKSVAFSPSEKAVFSTGARDGNIMVWDTRCSKKDGYYRQVKQISGAHNKSNQTPSKTKRRQQSVTVVLFRDEHTLSPNQDVGSEENYTAHCQDPVPLQMYPYPGSCMRTRLGYSGLALDSSRSNVMCNCTDDNIYMFNRPPNSSFYVKSSLSPDDQFLASGSSNKHIHLEDLRPSHPPVILQGHSEEVTSVVWCPSDFTKIASCSDDHTVRIWRLHREADGAPSSVGEANLVGWARPVSVSRPPVRAECTPAKNQRKESVWGLCSPQPASCAPSGAALPLSTSTASPAPSQNAKSPQFARDRRPPSSSGCPRSAWGPHLRTAPRRAGSSARAPRTPPAAPLPPSAGPNAGWRPGARRLHATERTGAAASPNCTLNQEEPGPLRGLRPPGDSSERTDSEDGVKPASTTRTDKENRSPRTINWLSVMGQKMKKGQRSPRTPRSSRKHEVKSPAAAVSNIRIHVSFTICKDKDLDSSTPYENKHAVMKKISVYFTKKPQE
uniref:Denticleless E3 ubiquitin protein ligase homolog (Drosophila) n=1 Tax=Salarias fasciatus TaxID=181472 RepID=A0A672HFV8_SALFA